MKQNRFLGIFLATFVILGFSYTPSAMAGGAVEALEGDTFKMVGEDAVDAEGNVLKDVTQEDVEALNKALAEGTTKSLDELASEFSKGSLLKAGSPEALDAIQANRELSGAMDELKDTKLQARSVSTSPGEVSQDLGLGGEEGNAGTQPDISTQPQASPLPTLTKEQIEANVKQLTGLNRMSSAVDRVETTLNNSVRDAGIRMKNLAEDIQANTAKSAEKMDVRSSLRAIKRFSPEDLERLSERYPLKNANGDFVDIDGNTSTKPVADPAIKDLKKAIQDAQKAGDKAAVQKLSVQVAKYEAAAGQLEELSNLDKLAQDQPELAGFSKNEKGELVDTDGNLILRNAEGKFQLADGTAVDPEPNSKIGKLRKAINDSLDTMDEKFQPFEENPKSLTEQVSTGVTGPDGKEVMQTKADVFAQDMQEITNKVSKDFQSLKDDIEQDADPLRNSLKVGRLGRAEATLKSAAEDWKKSARSRRYFDEADSFGTKVTGKIGEYLGDGAKMILAGCMFMIPNIFQSSFLAQKQRQAQLQSLANPIKFGDWVFQIPPMCFDFDNPSATLPIYLRVPTATAMQAVSADMLTAFDHTIQGPSTDNAVSSAIHSVGATILSFGGDLTARPKRYWFGSRGSWLDNAVNEDHDTAAGQAAYLSFNPGIVLAYFAPGGFQTTGSVPLTSGQFTSGEVIDVTTGLVIDSSGSIVNTTGVTGYESYPLIAPIDWHAQQAPSLNPDSVKDLLSTLGSTLDLSGESVKYEPYVTVTSGASGSSKVGVLESLFNCSCLSNDSKTACGEECLINKAFKRYEQGLSFNDDGTVGIGLLLAFEKPAKDATSSTTTKKSDKKLTAAEKAAKEKEKLAKDAKTSKKVAKNLTQAEISANRKAAIAAASSTDDSGLTAEEILAKHQAKVAAAREAAASTSSTAAAAITNNLGSVVPMFGWGTNSAFPELINKHTFPGHGKLNLSMSGSGRVVPSSTTGKSDSANAIGDQFEFADPARNYSLEGCWVYISASTPFAKAVQNGSSQTSAYGPYVDYIIFLDADGNQVPLMAPIQAGNGQKQDSTMPYTYTTIGLNPHVKYWTSIAAFDQDSGKALYQFQDATTGNPLKYDLQGNASWDASLGGKKGIIQTAINALGNFGSESTNLLAQFTVHQQVMIDKINNGPFMYGSAALIPATYGNVGLKVKGVTSDTPLNIVVPGQGGSGVQAEIVLYTGAKCFGTDVDDLLVPFDTAGANSGGTATLPDSNATQFLSLVTDIVYTVSAGSLVPSDFSNAPLNLNKDKVTYSLNKQYFTSSALQDASSYNVLTNELEASLVSGYPLQSGQSSYISADLDSYVQQQRKKWGNNFDPSAQKQGIMVGELTCTMPSAFISKEAIKAGVFIYEISPLPSAAYCDHDLFILTNSSQPTLSDSNMVNAEMADSQKTIAVSLLTGFLFDMNGDQLKHSDGSPRRIQTPTGLGLSKVSSVAQLIFNVISPRTAYVTSTDFEEKYNLMVKAYEVQAHRPMGPYPFGDLSLGIFAGDYAIGNYVYFTPTNTMRNADFAPTDVFMTYDGTSKLGAQLATDTPYVLSLVSGNMHNAAGTVVTRLPEQQLLAQTGALATGWGQWLKNIVTTLQKETAARLAAQNEEQTAVDQALADAAKQHEIDSDFMVPSAVQEIIARVQPGGLTGLATPYGLLQYDPVKQIYIHPSPATDTTYLYLFFNIGIDKKSKEAIGGIFTAGGNLVHVVKGVILQAMKDRFGVVINENGTESLGVPLTQPSFIMPTPPDKNFKFGQDSSDLDLISSLSVYFPGSTVEMPKGYWLYYSKTMDTYFVYEEKNQRWISVTGGHLYEKDGSAIPLGQQVAFLSKSSKSSKNIPAADDMILLYPNPVTQTTEGFMSNGQNYIATKQNGVVTWTSLTDGSSFPVTENSTQGTYVVGTGTSKKTYIVDNSVEWYSLLAVSDMTDPLKPEKINQDVLYAQLVVKAGAPVYMIFEGMMFVTTGDGKGSDSYLMEPVDTSLPGSINVEFSTDEDTQAPYVVVTSGNKTYRYLYQMDVLDSAQQDFYAAKFKGTPTAATIAMPVGKEKTKSVTMDAKQMSFKVPEATTHVLFARDIPSSSGTLKLSTVEVAQVKGVPVKGSSAYQQFQKTAAAFYDNLGMVSQSSDGRFFAEIQPAAATQTPAPGSLSFPYVSQGAYVDLQTGILYDPVLGVSLGYSLNLDDWLTVLNKVCVSVVVDTNSKKPELVLTYRSPQVIKVQTSELVADTKVTSATASADAKVRQDSPVNTKKKGSSSKNV